MRHNNGEMGNTNAGGSIKDTPGGKYFQLMGVSGQIWFFGHTASNITTRGMTVGVPQSISITALIHLAYDLPE